MEMELAVAIQALCLPKWLVVSTAIPAMLLALLAKEPQLTVSPAPMVLLSTRRTNASVQSAPTIKSAKACACPASVIVMSALMALLATSAPCTLQTVKAPAPSTALWAPTTAATSARTAQRHAWTANHLTSASAANPVSCYSLPLAARAVLLAHSQLLENA